MTQNSKVQKSSNCIKSKADFMPIFSYILSASGPCWGASAPQTPGQNPPLLDTELRPCQLAQFSRITPGWASATA